MKKGIAILIVGLFAITISVSIKEFSYQEKNITPDSGWDYDYGGSDDYGSDDYGSDWGSDWGSSSYDSDYGYSGTSGGSYHHTKSECHGNWWSDCGGREGIIAFGCIILAAVIVLVVGEAISKIAKKITYKMDHSFDNTFNKIETKSKIKDTINRHKFLSAEDLKEYNLDYDYITEKACQIYRDVQIAWMNFDYDTLRDNLSDELFNNYQAQLETLMASNKKNIMDDITIEKVFIHKITKDKGLYTIEMFLQVNQVDYVVSMDKPRKPIRGNKKNHDVLYEITYTMSKKKSNKCPNCGTKLGYKASMVCPACGSVITTDNHDLVMVKKQTLVQ